MDHKEYPEIGEKVHSAKLQNGLQIYVVPKKGYHKYFAFFATDYGGADRRFMSGGGPWTDTPEGVAHFLEHKMFAMEEGDAMTKLSMNGASANAFTSTDITAYYFDCIEMFPENLKILLDFVSTPYFTAESVEKEQGIITQEILMCDDDPDHCLYYGLLRSLFKTNPLRDPVAGTVGSISRITAGTLYDCHRAFYTPSNMVLCVAGDVEPSEIADIAEKALPETQSDTPRRDYGPEEALRPESGRWSKEMEVSLPLFLAGCKAKPAQRGPDSLRLDLISALALDVLAGHSSPLYFRLYGEGLISSDFSAAFDSSAGSAYMFFGGETRDPDRVFGEVCKEIRRLSESGPDPELFRRIKKAAIGSHIRMLNSFDSICGSLGECYFRGYDAFEAPDILRSITGDEVTAFFLDRMLPDNMAISVINPK